MTKELEFCNEKQKHDQSKDRIADGARPGKWWDDKTVRGPRQKTRVDIRVGTRLSIRVNTRASSKRSNKRRENSGQKEEKDPIKVRSFTSALFS